MLTHLFFVCKHRFFLWNNIIHSFRCTFACQELLIPCLGLALWFFCCRSLNSHFGRVRLGGVSNYILIPRFFRTHDGDGDKDDTTEITFLNRRRCEMFRSSQKHIR